MAVAELARKTDVSRQTIYAIEDGSFLPNTVVALKLARALDVTVEDLFCLEEDEAGTPVTVEAEWLSDQRPRSVGGGMVRLCGTGKRKLALPVQTAFSFLPEVDGIVQKQVGRRVRIGMLPGDRQSGGRAEILVAGCDPALSLLAEEAHSLGVAVVPIPVSSRKALAWLAQGKVDIAGTHLPDRESEEFNLGAIRQAFPRGGVRALTFAQWESGLVIQTGNPKRIRSIADLASGAVTIVNRERGSGSRAQLDREINRQGIQSSRIKGYEREVHGHLPAAFGVASGWADCCLATRSAARCYGLGFVPLRSERFDLVMPVKFLKSKIGQSLADLLNRAKLRGKLERLAGYDAKQTGQIVV